MAQNLLIGFVIEVSSLYDPCFMTCNFHYLLHIHEETISAFRFENYLQTIKKQVKKSNNAAAQIYNRHVVKSYTLKRKQKNADIIFGRQLSDNEELYSFLKTNNFYFSVDLPNNICYVNENVVLINKIKKIENVPFFEGKIIINLQPLFDQPYNSSNFGIFKVDEMMK